MHYAVLIINYMTFKERMPEHGGKEKLFPGLFPELFPVII